MPHGPGRSEGLDGEAATPPLPLASPTRRVSRRVVLGLLSMGVLLIAVSGLALYDLARFHRELTSLAHTALPEMTIASELSSQLQLLVNQVDRLATVDSHPGRRIAQQDVNRKFQRIKDYMAQVERLEGGQTLANLLVSLDRTLADLNAVVAQRIEVAAQVDRAQATVTSLSGTLKGLIEETDALHAESLRGVALWVTSLEGISAQAVRASRKQRLIDIRQTERQIQQSLEDLSRYQALVSPNTAARFAEVEQQMADALFAESGLFPALVERMRVASSAAGLGNQARLLVEEVSKLARDMFASINTQASHNATALWSEVERQAMILAALAVVALGAAVGVYFYFRHFLTNRLTALNEGVLGRIAGHTTRIDERGEDEISAIARSINFFLAEINRRQEEVLAREQQFRSVVQGSVQAILVLSHGKVLFANPAFSHMFALSGETERVPIRALLPNAVWPLVSAPDEDFTQGSQTLERVRACRTDGSVLWVNVAVSPIHWQGEIVRQVTVMDVTQSVLAEETLKVARDRAEEAARAKARFMATMSHEIRTPMNAILGLSHLALKTSLTPQQRDYLGKLRSSAGVLLSIINDILDFSKIEAGKMDLEDKPFDLASVLETLSTIVVLPAATKNLEFLFDIPAEVPYGLVGDSLRLEQILLNLTNNAVKFTDRGEVVLAVRVVERTGDQVHLSFAVRDTGIGISADHHSRLFAAFSQADNSTTRRFGGTGLGLAISRQLAELMGGTIEVASSLGQGSTFTLTLPFRLAEHQPPSVQEAAADLPRSLPVLVVEDHPTARALLAAQIEALGIPCQTAATPEEALDRLAAGAGGVVLVDKGMTVPPGGAPLSRLLHARCQGMERPARLILLGYHGHDPDADHPEALHREGVSTILYKPMDSRAVIRALKAALGTGEAVAAELPPPPPHQTDESGGLRGVTILVAEDNEINQQVARELLEAAGATVEVVATGRAAVNRVLTVPPPPDVVLMDVQMPEMDGVEATQRIRDVFSPQALPILAVTAHAADLEHSRCRDAGVNGYLMKPVDPDVLIRTIRSTLSEDTMRRRALLEDLDPQEAKASPVLPAQLGPFDLTEARHYTDGKEALLLTLLTTFQRRFAPLVEQLHEAASGAGSWEDILHNAHSLKGAALTLGNTSLGQAAATLEQALRLGSGTEARAEAAQACGNALLLALSVLDSALPQEDAEAETPPPLRSAAPVSPPLPPRLQDQMTALLGQIRSNRLSARATFASLAPALVAAGVSSQQVETARAALERLDFAAAATALAPFSLDQETPR